jgi:betaine-aldehyde dehydrogenase
MRDREEAPIHPPRAVRRERVFAPERTPSHAPGSAAHFFRVAGVSGLRDDFGIGFSGVIRVPNLVVDGRWARVANRLRHGTVWINDFHPYLPQAEWGGFGHSGVGRELGPSGLDVYREAKHIYHNIRPQPMRWFRG